MLLTEAKITAFLAKHFGTLNNEKFKKAQLDLAELLLEVVMEARAPLLLQLQERSIEIQKLEERMEDVEAQLDDLGITNIPVAALPF